MNRSIICIENFQDQINTTITTNLQENIHRKKPFFKRKRCSQSDKSTDSKRSVKVLKSSDYDSQFKPVYSKHNTKIFINNEYILPKMYLENQSVIKKKKEQQHLNNRFQQQLVNEQQKLEKANENHSNQLTKQIRQLQNQLQSKIIIQSELEVQLLQLKRDFANIKKNNEQIKKQNLILLEQIDKLRLNNTKSIIDKRKLESEKSSLIKKITFLEKINYSVETRNLQSLREEYLTSEIESLKQKINANKGDYQRFLEIQNQKIQEKLYETNKILQIQKTAINCLQQKIQYIQYSSNLNDQNIKLRTQKKNLVDKVQQLTNKITFLKNELKNKQIRNDEQQLLYDLQFSIELE